MDTNKLKRFAGEARVKLKAGVASMLQLYGFDANGNASTMPERITGGAIFNGTTITDIWRCSADIQKDISQRPLHS